MDRKGRSSVEVSVEDVKAALSRATTLTGEEERVLRMRLGVGAADVGDLLPRAAGRDQRLADELLLLEMQLFREQIPHALRLSASPVSRAPGIETDRRKHKIIRALRKKK